MQWFRRGRSRAILKRDFGFASHYLSSYFSGLSEESRPALMVRALLVLGLLSVLAPMRAADIEFVTQEMPWAVLDKAYSPPPLEARTSGACPSGGISYAVISGVLPPGLELS